MSTTSERTTQVQSIREKIEGRVFNIQRYSVQDGPGIRTTVFLKGCPLRCAWCSNPESQNPAPEIVHRDSLCNNCGQCVQACPVRAISVESKKISINRQICTECGKCLEVCIPGALKIMGQTLTVEDVFEQIRKDAEFYRDSGGGITVSGGEPLSQPDFVAALFQLCQKRGFETCIETSGCAGGGALDKVLPFTSLVLFDLKLSEPASHLKWTGKTNTEIISNLDRVVSSKIPVIIRIPLIPGINDYEEELTRLAQIAVDMLPRPGKVNLLPYHRFGMGKYAQLDREYALPELITQKDPEVQKNKELFESFGLECEIVL